MDREPSAVHVIRLFTEKVEKLGVAEGDQEVKGVIRITHNKEQCRFPVSQRVQLQLVIGGHFPQFGDVKGSQPRAAAHQNRLRGFA